MDENNIDSELEFLNELEELLRDVPVEEDTEKVEVEEKAEKVEENTEKVDLEETLPDAPEEEAEAVTPEEPEEEKEPKKEKAPKKKKAPRKATKVSVPFMKPQAKKAVAKETPNEVPMTTVTAPVNAKRRPKLSKQEMFKQTTLPLIILAVAALLIVIFIIGSITRAVQKNHIEKEASIAVSESIAEEQARLEAEMNNILEQAEKMVAGYDFDGAITLIDSFSGNIGGYPQLQDARARYEYSKESLVPWEDPNSIINLSFQTLLADTSRAFTHDEYASSLKKNFVTVDEFQMILERLYENNYILVSLKDLVETTTAESGAVTYAYKPLLLPEGKKPLLLTQTNVNYNLYLVDSDEDLVADKNGVGIASKLVFDAKGNITAEIVNADGSTSTGAYDLVPILDAFVEKHPDFSYRGAKAVLALTGYNGLFGYRTHAEARATLGEAQYEQDVAAVQAIAKALTDSGYELGCYTYGNSAYGKYSLSQIQSDMNSWLDEVTPVLGELDIMVFAQNSDINSGLLYSGEKFDYLKGLGFNFFLGFSSEGDSSTYIAENYVRQGRLIVSGSNIKNNSKWFNGIFDTTDLLDEARDN